jgi:hypothetical protein
LQGLKTFRVQYAKHHHQAKPTTTNKGFSTLALPFALIATETLCLDGMGKKGLGLSIKWMK